MKSEERHQLAKNDLQQTLDRWLDKLEPYSNHILGGILLATAIAVGVILWMRTSEASVAAGWTELSSARSAEDFLKVAEDYPDSNAAQWARLRAARMLYVRAVDTSLTNRSVSDDDFNQARDLFNGLLKSNPPKEVREAALDGIARVLESTSSGDTKDAIDAYETLVREFPDSVNADYAKHRIEVLKKPEVQEFYAWFRKQNPKPVERPQPKDGATAEDPFGALDLPNLNFPPAENTPPATSDTKTAPAAGDAAKSPVDTPLTVPPLPDTGNQPVTPPATESSESAPPKTETPESAPAATKEFQQPAESAPPPAN